MAGHLLQKCLVRCAKASSFYTTMLGFILPTWPAKHCGYAVTDQAPYCSSLMLSDFHLFVPLRITLVASYDMQQAFYTNIFCTRYKPWCHEGTNVEMSVALIWSSEVCLLLPTCHPSQNNILGIRVFVTLFFWNSFVMLKEKHTVLCVHSMKAHRVGKGIAPLIFNFSTRWMWVIRFMLQLFYHWYQLNIRLDGPQR